MGVAGFARTGRLTASVPATVAMALTAAVLAWGGPAAAAAHQDRATAPRATAGPAGTISTVAGGVGGPARATNVGIRPEGLAFGAGRVYIADDGAIRAGEPADRLADHARGHARRRAARRRRPATEASLSEYVSGVAVDHSGNLVIADTGNNRIRVVAASTGTFYGQAMTAGHIYTVAGNGTAGASGDGGPATSAELDGPGGVAVSHRGTW